MEHARVYKSPLYPLFVDYEKAFDSFELNAVLRVFIEGRIDENYDEIAKKTSTGCSTDIFHFTHLMESLIVRVTSQALSAPSLSSPPPTCGHLSSSWPFLASVCHCCQLGKFKAVGHSPLDSSLWGHCWYYRICSLYSSVEEVDKANTTGSPDPSQP